MILLKECIQTWSEELAAHRRYSVHTVKAYCTDLQNFLIFLGQHIDDQINLDTICKLQLIDIRSWLSHRIQAGMKARSNARALSAIKSFFAHLKKQYNIQIDAMDFIRRPKLDQLLPKPIPKDIIDNFLNSEYFFEHDPLWITNRDKALFSLLYCTGLRISEAINIKTKDVYPDMKISGKGKKDRVVILLPIVLERIKVYIETCPYDISNGYLFVGLKGKRLQATLVNNRLRKLRGLYNLPEHAVAHSFRHSFATHVIQNGADLRSVQELLGHESLASTQIYTDIDDITLLKMYANTHPLAEK